MLSDAILAAWRTWLIWHQINQTRSVLLMLVSFNSLHFDDPSADLVDVG
jgi:hypothetical protein